METKSGIADLCDGCGYLTANGHEICERIDEHTQLWFVLCGHCLRHYKMSKGIK